MILPTNFSPKYTLKLTDGLAVEPYKRVGISHAQGTDYSDSIAIHNYEEFYKLKRWIIFHSFLLDSHLTQKVFEKDLTKNMEILEEKIVNVIDYEDILPYVYFFQGHLSNNPRKSYNELHKMFIEQPSDNIDLVINYLTRFNTDVFRPSRAITDTSYWQLVVYYSIIDKIIGEPPFCEEKFECTNCKRFDLPHHSIPTNEWLRKKLTDLISENPTSRTTYEEIIRAVKKHIRHKTVHGSKIPTAKKFPSTKPGERITYDFKKSIGDYKHDHHALDSLVYLMKDVTKYLLLDHLFGLKIFPIPNTTEVITISMKNKS